MKAGKIGPYLGHFWILLAINNILLRCQGRSPLPFLFDYCHAFQLTPSTRPQEIVQQQLTALQQDDMDQVYKFASPGNKERTGDVTRFGQMVRSGPYKYLIKHSKSIILMEATMAQSQQFLVRIVPGDYEKSGRVLEYWWSLSRCNGGEFSGSYMVDAVIPNQ
jgi:hypothetical protein